MIDGSQSQPSPLNYSALNSTEKLNAKSGIIISPDQQLTIDVDIIMNSGTSILVKAGTSSSNGAVLILAAKLTTTNTITSWQGIKVVGDSGTSHFNTKPDSTTFNDKSAYYGVLNQIHGRVRLMKTAIIEKALHGVEAVNGGIVESLDIDDASLRAGIGPTFTNCREGLFIQDYYCNDAEHISAYRLNGIKFISNSLAAFSPASDYSDFVHVTISNVKAVYLGGCHYRNDDINTFSPGARGRGVFVDFHSGDKTTLIVGEAGDVFAVDATTGCTKIKVYDKLTNTYRGSFTYLSQAILGTISVDCSVNSHDFYNNFSGVKITGSKHFLCEENFFEGSEVFIASKFSSFSGGGLNYMAFVELILPKDVLVHGSTFRIDNKLQTPFPALKIEQASGNKILIMNNYFYGDYSTSTIKLTPVAILANGNLSNMEWICNFFTEYTVDVQYGSNYITTIGPSKNPVNVDFSGNTYSANVGSTNLVNNTSDQLNYKYYPNLPSKSGDIITNFTIGELNCTLTCDKIKDWFDPSKLSVSELKHKHLRFYPNPASSFVILDLDPVMMNLNGGRLLLIDIAGKIILNQQLNADNKLDVGSLNEGLYMLKLVTQTGIYTGTVQILR